MSDYPLLISLAGWTGAALLLASYALVSVRKLEASGAAFQWMNVVGSALLATNSAHNGAWPSAILNVVWLGIGAVALLRLVSNGLNTRKSRAHGLHLAP
ncbi:hypothetical protein LZC95_30275 [Pendulispora brunnea]|uniref:CBU-0592-like domain-containing protein n=1 Tax=Pendulispora brunnea TaxID=2905690 RepID=A0ABZ2K059_9BACT